MKELTSGWTVEQTIMHFSHIATEEAEALLDGRDDVHVVETINSTFDDTQTMLHRNKYFEVGFSAALGLATKLELTFLGGEIAEQVISVRQATDEEAEEFWEAYHHFNEDIEAIAD